MKTSGNKGFTLVELSIVIVIIGLIVAGVVAGQGLVKQAQLRAVVTESEAAKIAINAFKLQYNALPGDMTNATAYWTTGDGDGDRTIELTSDETFRAWQHLQLAGLYSGSFTGTATSSLAVLGVNIPASKYSKSGIMLIYDNATTAATGVGAAGRQSNKNVVLFGAVTAGIANAGVFSAPQAFSLDTKVDDGSPTTGSVLGSGTTTEAVTTCLASATAYNLDATAATPCAEAFTF